MQGLFDLALYAKSKSRKLLLIQSEKSEINEKQKYLYISCSNGEKLGSKQLG